MLYRPKLFKTMNRLAALLLCLAVAAAFLPPLFARAEESGNNVRVGWYASPFNQSDQLGRRSGYAYEYQRKIAAYTGWSYTYVEGNWRELLQMLEKGEIDLMSDVSYTPERAGKMLYPSYSMGTEAYYIYILPGSAEITSDAYASLNGKRVGVTQSSIQRDIFLSWEEKHGVQAELVELTGSEEDSIVLLQKGEIDGFLTLDSYADPDTLTPVFKVGSSDFYFVVNKDRPDLLVELEAALSRIQDENRYYNEQLNDRYLRTSGPNLYLTADEKEWAQAHGPIRVGYQDNYLAFCARDEKTGELTGALKDFLSSAAASMENAALSFEDVAFPTAAAAMDAMKKGEVDCMFPANLTDYDGEEMGVVMSPALMRTEMRAVVRSTDQQSFLRREKITVAVNEGNPNYDMFLVDHYPGWAVVHYKDTPACLEAVARGEADCIIISNYRFNNIAKQCEKLRLATVSTGVDLDYCFAVNEGDTALYSVLAKAIGAVPASTVNAALTYYSTEDAKTTFWDFVRDHMVTVLAVITVLVLIFIILVLRDIRAEKKASQEAQIVNDLNKRVFVDALTSVRNKGAFANYVQDMQSRLDQKEEIAFAVGVFDCDNLKAINDQYGHDKGDLYLKAACRLICKTFQHSPVFRIGGDEFATVLINDDFINREQLIARFRQMREETCAAAENPWDQVHIAMGVAAYDPALDAAVQDTVRRADKIMYENKRSRKKALRT